MSTLKKEFVRMIRKGKKRCHGKTQEGCKAKLLIVKSKFEATISIIQFVKCHNHPLVTPRSAHLLGSHWSISKTKKDLTRHLFVVNIPTPQQIDILGLQTGDKKKLDA